LNDLGDNLPICLAFDNAYLYPFMIFAYSARANSSKPIRFIIILDGENLSNSSILIINQILGLLDIEVEYLHSNFKFERTYYHVSSVSMQRLLFFDLLDTPFIYMDIDILLTPGWDEILDMKFFENGVVLKAASVENEALTDMKADNLNRRAAGTILNQAVATDRYFNAGVMIGNPVEWKNFNLHEKWKVAFFHDFERLGLEQLDQDLLNYLLIGKTSNLGVGFNFLTGFMVKSEERIRQQFDPSQARPHVLHFLGRAKPWNWSAKSKAAHLVNIVENRADWIQGSTCRDFAHYWLTESLVENWILSIPNNADLLELKESLDLVDY